MSSVLSGGGSGEFGLGKDSLQLSDFERDLAAKLLRPETMMLFADDRLVGYLVERIIMTGFPLPISQVQGFTQFLAQAPDLVTATETTTSNTWVDLTTVGPQLTGLPDGEYIAWYGANSKSSVAAGEAFISVALNGSFTDPDPDNYIAGMGGTSESASFASAKVTLSSGNNNSIKVVYRTGATASTATYRLRRLVVLKVDNI